MKNKKRWLIIKGMLLLLVALILIAVPVVNFTRTLFRFFLLIVFTISFIIDLINYKKSNAE